MLDESKAPLELIRVREGTFFGETFQLWATVRNNSKKTLALTGLWGYHYVRHSQKGRHLNMVHFLFGDGLLPLKEGQEVTADVITKGRKTIKIEFPFAYGLPHLHRNNNKFSECTVYPLTGVLKRRELDNGWEMDYKATNTAVTPYGAQKLYENRYPVPRYWPQGKLVTL